ncbi:MAG: DUF3830 family protein [Caldilineaceae bacterium]|nr:DUF3830 family protein [Caldilineaceae bacterium]
MARQFELIFTKRNVRGVATLLEAEAPLTCEAFWNALPLEGDAYHARWAGREVYTLVPPFGTDPGKENATILPIPGDLLYFELNPASIDFPPERRTGEPIIDIALFYGRNNFLLGPDGYAPGNLFATITENLECLAEACESIWREGFVGERMVMRRVD